MIIFSFVLFLQIQGRGFTTTLLSDLLVLHVFLDPKGFAHLQPVSEVHE